MAPPAELATSELNRHHFYGGLRDGMSGTADDHHSQRPRSRSSGPTVCRCGKSQLRKCRWGGPGHSLRDKRSRRAGRTSPLVEGSPLTAAPGNCHPALAIALQRPARTEQICGGSHGCGCCTSLLYPRSCRSNFISDLWSYGDSNPRPLACHPAAARLPASIPAGRRPSAFPIVRRHPGRLLYFAAVPISCYPRPLGS
jgi:hypothetical protein